jgi:hypothetical protein
MMFLTPATTTAVQAAHRLREPTSFIMDLSPLVILYVTNTQPATRSRRAAQGLLTKLTDPAIANVRQCFP